MGLISRIKNIKKSYVMKGFTGSIILITVGTLIASIITGSVTFGGILLFSVAFGLGLVAYNLDWSIID